MDHHRHPVKPQSQAYSRRQGNKNAVLLLTERTVEKRVLERHHEILRAVIKEDSEHSVGLDEGALSYCAGREHRKPNRVVLENLYRLISGSPGQDSRRTVDGIVAEIYQRMAVLPLLMKQARAHSLDIYA